MMSSNKDDAQQEMPLHCGKWTPEEEAYVQCLIEEFQAGFLPIREGTSLRSFLSKMLNCKPKRISKKFEGSDYNGKQVYVSQPYKLTPEEARERRERLCTLESKFHQSVAELKNAEGVKQQGIDGRLEAATAGLDASSGSQVSAATSVGGGMTRGGSLGLGGGSGSGLGGAGGPSFGGAGASMSSFMGGGAGAGGLSNDMNAQNSQYLEELAFQDSMLRLRAQQQQQQQQHQQQQNNLQQQQNNFQQQQHQQGGAGGSGPGNGLQQGPGAAAGSYVDPILGSLALSQNSMNTTPLAASQYWRRQALLEASSHMDSLRMAQAGAIGIQRPVLEPGGLRDLRVPANLSLGGFGGDDSSQHQQMQQHLQNNNNDGSYGGHKEAAGASGFKKRKGGNDGFGGSGDNYNDIDSMKRVRRAGAEDDAAAARNMPFQSFGY